MFKTIIFNRCECNDGYVRNGDNECVLLETCPSYDNGNLFLKTKF